MQLINDINSDVNAAKKLRLSWWGVLCIIVGALPIYWLFDHSGRLNIALPTLNFVGMIIFAIVIKKNLRRQAWFWITTVILAAVHLPLILFVPWTTRWVPAAAITAIDSADLIVMLAVFTIVEKFVKGSRTA